MSSHFKWYASSEETVVPFNGRYQFPAQSTKAEKLTPRIPAKNGSSFTPGSVTRHEFPAQGYVNPANTFISMDVTLYAYENGSGVVRFQNNIQSLFSRGRLLYGANPVEDIIGYNQIVRNQTEWTATNQTGTLDQTSINEGIGGVTVQGNYSTGNSVTKYAVGWMNTRQSVIQGIATDQSSMTVAPENFIHGNSRGKVGGKYRPTTEGNNAGVNNYVTRRYTVQPMFGVFLQDKLIPTKFMASQLAMEFTLETAAGCMFVANTTGTSGNPPTYTISNMTLLPEILQFDASYDATFLKGLREGGV